MPILVGLLGNDFWQNFGTLLNCTQNFVDQSRTVVQMLKIPRHPQDGTKLTSEGRLMSKIYIFPCILPSYQQEIVWKLKFMCYAILKAFSCKMTLVIGFLTLSSSVAYWHTLESSFGGSLCLMLYQNRCRKDRSYMKTEHRWLWTLISIIITDHIVLTYVKSS